MSSKGDVINLFKLHGLAIRGDAAKYLCELLEPLEKEEHEEWVEKVIEAVQKLPLSSSLISRQDIHKAAQEVGASENDDVEALLQVINIFRIPKFIYNIERRKFMITTAENSNLHGDAMDKAALFRDRYTTVYQRTCNHDLFRQPVVGAAEDGINKKFGLVKVEYLLGSSSRVEGVVVLGLLIQLVEGRHHLEDDTGAVPLSLTTTKFHTGLFTHNCFVLVEGWYEDETLHAAAIGLPPPEAPDVTRALLGNVNYFGGPGDRCAKSDNRLLQLEHSNTSAMFVILADLWLDKIKVMDKLRTLFAGYAGFPPTAFILCGNFLSAGHGAQQTREAHQAFTALGSLIASFPELVANSRFIFVPGPTDPGPSNIFPRPPLPRYVTEEIKKSVPTAIFTSNPARLLYCTQEIVVFREDIVAKMCRNSVYFPTNSDDIPAFFAKTVISQAHLAPVPPQVVPTYWPLDRCLALHPSPDLIVAADKGDSFTSSYNSAVVVNPGSFSKNDFSFKVYLPSSKQVEDSQIGDDET
ncbi:hypothetical protein Pcinc_034724 [Petrolisthes cinctipes]|uniref:DNA polymerase epsilon subunit n=1 Tax=Petrolisthes cinctipes TaxID=88211 RepID=A0AAE1EPA2_PETCI|nr:hypothetical protein Pcinc_034724 [Petrolisthes cinctipes]